MQAFCNLVEGFYPDQYKFVCMQHDISEREAMDMYAYLRKVVSSRMTTTTWRVSCAEWRSARTKTR